MGNSSTATKIAVGIDGEPGRYDVTIGHGVLAGLPEALGEKVTRVAVIHPRTLRALGRTVNQQLAAVGLRPLLIEVPDGENAKTAETLTMCWALLGQAGFTRSDAVVGLGGGAVTDLAGFVAASWLRGVPVVQVSTTLLGMVDAAVGGKTGINTSEGKNLVGAFHPPSAVICDLDALRTLPHADLVAGLGEVVKCGLIADPVILDLIQDDPTAATTWDSAVLRDLVQRAIAVKAKVVTNDLKESGEREFLNYGHTFAHGVEQVEQYTWRHGEAVSVGMMYVARLGELAGRTPPELVARHTAALSALGLPRTYRGDRWPALLAAMGRDKKNRGDLMRFIVLDDLAKPGRLEGPAASMLEAAYRLISE